MRGVSTRLNAPFCTFCIRVQIMAYAPHVATLGLDYILVFNIRTCCKRQRSRCMLAAGVCECGCEELHPNSAKNRIRFGHSVISLRKMTII